MTRTTNRSAKPTDCSNSLRLIRRWFTLQKCIHISGRYIWKRKNKRKLVDRQQKKTQTKPSLCQLWWILFLCRNNRASSGLIDISSWCFEFDWLIGLPFALCRAKCRLFQSVWSFDPTSSGWDIWPSHNCWWKSIRIGVWLIIVHCIGPTRWLILCMRLRSSNPRFGFDTIFTPLPTWMGEETPSQGSRSYHCLVVWVQHYSPWTSVFRRWMCSDENQVISLKIIFYKYFWFLGRLKFYFFFF